MCCVLYKLEHVCFQTSDESFVGFNQLDVQAATNILDETGRKNQIFDTTQFPKSFYLVIYIINVHIVHRVKVMEITQRHQFLLRLIKSEN